ncbi:HTH_48 domain-containing protein [Trichonephila clavata]|uniref:HTH_48 domain-containing protein n=1 Tax=Trichonephila clavata TaxID=2740835 RepID=A0A8X6J123_TRICU|nr:HTH_48 domain-containing protein [Trichonephila clavata]
MSKQKVRRWCRTFSDGRQQVEDIPRAGRTLTATTDANVGKVDDMIRANRRITIDEVAEELGISHERAQNIIHDILRYRKVSARWVPRQLTATHQEHLVEIAEQANILDQQIEAWGLSRKPLENPFQVILNKKAQKKSQENDGATNQMHSKRARMDDVTPCSNKVPDSDS